MSEQYLKINWLIIRFLQTAMAMVSPFSPFYGLIGMKADWT